MKKLIFAIATVCLALTTVSCERDLAIFTYDENPCVFFPSASMPLDMDGTDGGKILVPVNRLNTKGDLETAVTFEDLSDGLFSCSQTIVSFKDGEDVAYVTVNYSDLSSFAAFTDYPFSLAIQGIKFAQVASVGKGSPYVVAEAHLKIHYNSLGTGSFVDKFFYENPETWDVEISNAVEDASHFYLHSIYQDGVDTHFYIEGGEFVAPYYISTGVDSGGWGEYIYMIEGISVDPINKALVIDAYLSDEASLESYSYGATQLIFTLPAGFDLSLFGLTD